MYLVIFTIGLIFLLLMNLFYKEGMESSCKYKYLAPIFKGPDGKQLPWNEDVMNKFIEKYNKINPSPGWEIDKNSVENMSNSWSEEEAKYFIEYGEFPLNSYLTDILKNDKNVRERISGQKKLTPDTVQKQYSVRSIHDSWIKYSLDDEKNKDKATEQKYKIADKIYRGETPDPCKQSAPNTKQSLLPTDINKLKEICKNVK